VIYDVMTPIENAGAGGSGTAAAKPGRKRTRWHRIGRAWSDGPERITIVLDSLPFRSEYVYLFKARDQTPSRDPEGPQHPEPGDAQG
jgi:hypothetical protein